MKNKLQCLKNVWYVPTRERVYVWSGRTIFTLATRDANLAFFCFCFLLINKSQEAIYIFLIHDLLHILFIMTIHLYMGLKIWVVLGFSKEFLFFSLFQPLLWRWEKPDHPGYHIGWDVAPHHMLGLVRLVLVGHAVYVRSSFLLTFHSVSTTYPIPNSRR